MCVLDVPEGESEGAQGGGCSAAVQSAGEKMIDAALLFQRKIEHVTRSGPGGGDATRSCEGPQRFRPDELSVIFLSEDKALLLAAKERGLPACRFRELTGFRNVRDHFEQQEPCTASTVRNIIGKSAVRGLNPLGPGDLQQEYDGAIACLKELLDAHEPAMGSLVQAKKLLASEQPPDVTIRELRALFAGIRFDQREAYSRGSESSRLHVEGSDNVDLVSGTPDKELVHSIREKLLEWDALVKSHQTASHVLR